jgi:hypothetical protein
MLCPLVPRLEDDMSPIPVVRDRLERADGLAAVLDAAYDAFGSMLSAIRASEDPVTALFIPLVMAAASAAEGRNALAFAPAFASRPLPVAPTRDEPADATSVQVAAASLAALSELLAARLTDAARGAPGRGDQAACRAAARSAQEIHALLTRNGP